jgi:hypothetical protein
MKYHLNLLKVKKINIFGKLSTNQDVSEANCPIGYKRHAETTILMFLMNPVGSS